MINNSNLTLITYTYRKLGQIPVDKLSSLGPGRGIQSKGSQTYPLMRSHYEIYSQGES